MTQLKIKDLPSVLVLLLLTFTVGLALVTVIIAPVIHVIADGLAALMSLQ